MLKKHDRVIAQTFGFTTWIWFAISGITVLFFLLANVNTDAEFKSVIIFSIVTIISFMILLMLGFITESGKSRLKGNDDIKLFFMQELTLNKLVYIPIGLIGVFAISLLTINSNVPYAAFFSIMGAGFIMLFCFLRTHTIIVPIIIHGMYNSIVVILRDQFANSVLSSAPINVPNIDISLGSVSNLASQILFQNFLVASAEEMFKILIMAFFVVTLRNKFVGTGGTIILGGIIATIVWSSFHYISALR